MGTDYLKPDENGLKRQICFGITFDETSSQKWTYNFHYNLTGRPDYRDLYGFDDQEDRVAPFQIEAPDILKRNIRGGMYYLINFIDTEILRYETGTNTAEINTRMVKAPTPEYKTSTVYDNISGNMHNLIVFPLVVLFLRFIYNILFEKENKIAQNLRNMGMSMY